MDIIVTAAERIFDISRFYDDDPEGPDQDDSDDRSDSNSESSSEDSSEESNDSEYGKKLKKIRFLQKSKAHAKKSKSLAEKSTLKSRSKGTRTPVTPIPKPSVPNDTDEVADLINRLGCFNLNGQGYPSLSFQIVSQAPNTASFLAKPRTYTGEATP